MRIHANSPDAIYSLNVTASGNRPADDQHTRIHQGIMYKFSSLTSDFNADILNNQNLDMVITTSSVSPNFLHLVFWFNLGGAGRFEVWELTEGSVTGGTEIPSINKKWDEDNSFDGTCLRNPVINMTGAKYKEAGIILGTVQGQTRAGGGGSRDQEILGVPNKPVLIRLRNQSGGTVKGDITLMAYNAPL